MKKLLSVLLIAVVFLAACGGSGTKNEQENTDSTQTAKLEIAKFEEIAQDYIDKEVVIEGTVNHVCQHGGKRMFIFNGSDDKVTVKITTEDVFETSLEGSDVVVKGIVKERRITADDIAKMEQEAMNTESDTTKSEIVVAEHDHDGEKEHEHDGEHLHDGEGKANPMAQVNALKKQLEESGKEYLSFYSIEAVEVNEKK